MILDIVQELSNDRFTERSSHLSVNYRWYSESQPLLRGIDRAGNQNGCRDRGYCIRVSEGHITIFELHDCSDLNHNKQALEEHNLNVVTSIFGAWMVLCSQMKPLRAKTSSWPTFKVACD